MHDGATWLGPGSERQGSGTWKIEARGVALGRYSDAMLHAPASSIWLAAPLQRRNRCDGG